MLKHLGIARQDLLLRKRVEKDSRYDRSYRFGKSTYLIFYTIEIYGRFATYRSIDSGKQCRGNIDAPHATLECGSGKTAHVANHTAA